MIYPNSDMLYYIAIGDAYCLATEYIKSPRDDELRAKALRFEKYLKHPTHGIRPGVYSDDTQMSAANAEVLIENDSFRSIQFANKWVQVFHRDPRDAYSRGFQRFLETTKTGKEFIINIDPSSNKNGGAMRSVPFGVLKTPEEVLAAATLQCKLTHDTPGGLFGSQAVALMSHFFLYAPMKANYTNLREFLFDNMKPTIREVMELGVIEDVFNSWDGRVQGPEVGINTALAVFQLVTYCKTLKEVLRQTIEWGGDTDSVAAIALGIASCRLEDDLREFMHLMLEPGSPYGTEYLKKTGSLLMEKYHDV